MPSWSWHHGTALDALQLVGWGCLDSQAGPQLCPGHGPLLLGCGPRMDRKSQGSGGARCDQGGGSPLEKTSL